MENVILVNEKDEIIGEMEMLQSLANFSYNNPDFCFPMLNDNYEIAFTHMSHPLLTANKRVSNNVTFQPQSFIILTGSNMSGKSTFLRSLGINMVLARMGSVVCASQANIHPMPILVSMRLSDSLSDSESYFYAEIKRLKQIMDALDSQRAFVLLDEAQNTTAEQIKMFLTRMGKNAKFIITGDPGQVDLPRRTISGLKEAILILKDVEGIGILYLDDKDIVRHRLVKKVIDAYKSIENHD